MPASAMASCSRYGISHVGDRRYADYQQIGSNALLSGMSRSGFISHNSYQQQQALIRIALKPSTIERQKVGIEIIIAGGIALRLRRLN